MSEGASRRVAQATQSPAARALGGRGASRRPSSRAGRRQLRRRRLAGLGRLVFFLLLVFIAVWAGVRVAHAGSDAAIYQGEKYVVASGDTLWHIAIRHYGDDVDPRRAVYDLREANGLTADVVLQPGDALALPYGGE
jgi:nucleoid-associated protein YgaU